VGLNFTTFNSVPFALVTNMVATADAGMYMGTPVVPLRLFVLGLDSHTHDNGRTQAC
jgi:hypothetical protein